MKDRDESTVITILYDHESTDEKLITDWGVSIHVKRGEKDILFDVGKDKNILLHNMDVLDIEKEDIDAIVISHRHWDHFGGLTAFEDREDIKIYVPNSLAKRIKEEFDLSGEIIPVKDRKEIFEGIYSTGELGRAIKEQSLFIDGKDGVYILTGCGHPGIKKIVKKGLEISKVRGVIGGYHGFDDLEFIAQIYRCERPPLLVPCHCSILSKKLKDRYPDSYKECKIGSKFKI
ncbi:MAG: MBL fold metallo-hydrolase [Thermoplasmata archaeon]